MRSRWVQLIVASAVVAMLAVAVTGLLAAPPGLRDRAYELEQRLRCPVCQSVSIAESPSETAQAMRDVVAEQVAAGRSDQEILDYFRARYGDWVLHDPPAAGSTLLLWLLPAAGAAVGAVALIMMHRRAPPPEPDDAVDRDTAAQQRVQALRDLTDLERQIEAGEIPAAVAQTLRRRYETTAAQSADVLQQNPLTRRRPARASTLVYGAAITAGILAVAVLLPQYVAPRPEGGFVTGNEVLGVDTAPSRDLSTVTEAEMEEVLAANPTVVGMRLALAMRYLENGDLDKAAEHYGVALKQDPGNPDVQAGAAGLLFEMGRPDAALRFVTRALEIDPSSRAAAQVLGSASGRADLPDHVRSIVNQLIAAREGER